MKLDQDLTRVVESLDFQAPKNLLSIPEDPKFGDYSTNVALQLSKQDARLSYQSAREIAEDILAKLGHPAYLERIETAGPGFINFWFKEESLLSLLSQSPNRNVDKSDTATKRIMLEYASPNAFKPLHIGQLRNLLTGESVNRLLAAQGNEVFKVTYSSDIGLSTAKALWGVLQLKDEYESSKSLGLKQRADFLGKAYVKGAGAYEDNEKAKAEIDEINKKLYQKDSDLMDLWQETRDISQAYLDTIYFRLGTEFDIELWESDMGDLGIKVVMENLGKVFVRENGAVIFPGEKYGLHTRVFITSQGNPTYEAKDLGLAFRQMEIYPFDEVIHVVGSEQIEYFKVLIKAVEVVEEKLIGKKRHLPYGFVNLSTGKMSSRTGHIVKAEDLIDQVKEEIMSQFGSKDVADKVYEQVAIGAVKFWMLKFGLMSDIAFDVKQSVSTQGDSGPYVQYTYARTQSLVAKSLNRNIDKQSLRSKDLKSDTATKATLLPEERNLLRLLEYFGLIVEEAADNFEPNKVANYLLELCRAFNLFYQTQAILGSEKESFRLNLTKKVGETIKEGLYLLGIEAPERM